MSSVISVPTRRDTYLRRIDQLLRIEASEIAIDESLEVADAALDAFGQAHVLETLGVKPSLLSRQVREILSGDPAANVRRHLPWAQA